MLSGSGRGCEASGVGGLPPGVPMSVLLAAAPAAGSLPADVDKDVAPSGWGEEAVIVSHGVAEQSKKGEDFWIAKCNVERAPGQIFNVYGVSGRASEAHGEQTRGVWLWCRDPMV